MADKKKKQKAKKILVLKSGETFEILCEQGKYYRCKGTQFRKTNTEILRVEPMKEAKNEAETEVEENADC